MPAPNDTSLIDRVDEADRTIGEIPRGRVFEEGAAFRVVHIFVFNSRGQLLLQQLGRNRSRNPLRWGSSVAGYLYAGESYVEGAVRRLREELGLSTSLVKIGSVSMRDNASLKFITLYRTSADTPHISEPGHIERISFWELDDIDDAILKRPQDFTETFRYIYDFYRTTSQLAGAS